eukprot:5229400-Lingulodinium_polyedra.AAC.1
MHARTHARFIDATRVIHAQFVPLASFVPNSCHSRAFRRYGRGTSIPARIDATPPQRLANRTPARTMRGPRVNCASMRFVNRCGCEMSMAPHHCATFRKRCAMTRSNRRFAATTAREPHARVIHAQTENRPAHGARKRAIREPARPQNAESTTSCCPMARLN